MPKLSPLRSTIQPHFLIIALVENPVFSKATHYISKLATKIHTSCN